jgi:hypothetical protein
MHHSVNQMERYGRQGMQQIPRVLDGAQVQGFALSIAQRVGSTVHARFEQVNTAFDRNQIQLVDMSGGGVGIQFLQVHESTLNDLVQRWTSYKSR